MTEHTHEIEQRRREAAEPFWAKLKWLEEASVLAMTIQASPPRSPPGWVSEMPTRQSGHTTPPPQQAGNQD